MTRSRFTGAACVVAMGTGGDKKAVVQLVVEVLGGALSKASSIRSSARPPHWKSLARTSLGMPPSAARTFVAGDQITQPWRSMRRNPLERVRSSSRNSISPGPEPCASRDSDETGDRRAVVRSRFNWIRRSCRRDSMSSELSRPCREAPSEWSGMYPSKWSDASSQPALNQRPVLGPAIGGSP
jgi:hypothetical protein